MSDVEGDDVPVAVASGPMDINTAIAEVLDYYLYIQMLSLTQFSHCLSFTLYISHTLTQTLLLIHTRLTT